MHVIVERLSGLGSAVRYVAVSEDGAEPEMWQRATGPDSSSSESDRYEELRVNPTLLTLATRRGEIDCGGLKYLVVRYGKFFQLVVPTAAGHVSVCLSSDADLIELTHRVLAVLDDVASGPLGE